MFWSSNVLILTVLGAKVLAFHMVDSDAVTGPAWSSITTRTGARILPDMLPPPPPPPPQKKMIEVLFVIVVVLLLF